MENYPPKKQNAKLNSRAKTLDLKQKEPSVNRPTVLHSQTSAGRSTLDIKLKSEDTSDYDLNASTILDVSYDYLKTPISPSKAG